MEEIICPEIPTTAEEPANKVAVFAMGWFWTPQLKFERMAGVSRAVVGYTGGTKINPSYRNIMDSTESILLEYDPSIISYTELLNKWASMHRPFYRRKTQYRSAIFVVDNEQQMEAEAKLKEMQKEEDETTPSSGEKIQTAIEPVGPFYRAEEYHQDFLRKSFCGGGRRGAACSR